MIGELSLPVNRCNSVIDLMKINSNMITNTAHSSLDLMKK